MTEAEQLVAGYDGPLRSQVIELAENVVFMAYKLKETRESMGKTPLIVRYDNGGGQSGYRENPVFKAYNQLMADYRKSMQQLADLLQTYGANAPSEDDTPLFRILREAKSA
jgi:hypothetical protein